MMFKGIQLEGTGLPILEVTKVTGIKFKSKDSKGRIYLEEMSDGKWRLTYTENTIPDIKKLTSLKLIRTAKK